MLFLSNEKKLVRLAYTTDQIGSAPILTWDELVDQPETGRSAEFIFSTWGIPCVGEAEIACYLPKLRLLFYAAGSVQDFARPFLRRGVRISTAAAINAIPVAEFAMAQIILANKGYFQLNDRYKNNGFTAAWEYGDHFNGNYQETVGIIGAGAIGKRVIKLLAPFDLNILVYDPFLPEEEAYKLGVQKAGLDEIFSTCRTISNHVPDNDRTKNMIDYTLLKKMKPYSTFINTGRGAQVVADDLCKALREQPGRSALLDVTDPIEPLPPEHELFTLPNAFITPHRAGSHTNEVRRMGQAMIDAYKRFISDGTLLYEVTEDSLTNMA